MKHLFLVLCLVALLQGDTLGAILRPRTCAKTCAAQPRMFLFRQPSCSQRCSTRLTCFSVCRTTCADACLEQACCPQPDDCCNDDFAVDSCDIPAENELLEDSSVEGSGDSFPGSPASYSTETWGISLMEPTGGPGHQSGWANGGSFMSGGDWSFPGSQIPNRPGRPSAPSGGSGFSSGGGGGSGYVHGGSSSNPPTPPGSWSYPSTDDGAFAENSGGSSSYPPVPPGNGPGTSTGGGDLLPGDEGPNAGPASTALPEPASFALWAGLGTAGLIAARRKRRTPAGQGMWRP